MPKDIQVSKLATYQFMLVLKMTGAVCEVRTNICLTLESMHAGQ